MRSTLHISLSTLILAVMFLVVACERSQEQTIEVSRTTHRSDAPQSVYSIAKLKTLSPKSSVDISGEWIGNTQYSPTVKLSYKLKLVREGELFKAMSLTDAENGMNLNIRNFEIDYPVIKFEADSGLFDGNMVPQPFLAEFVILNDEIKGHFRSTKTQRGDTTTYYNYDTDFRRVN